MTTREQAERDALERWNVGYTHEWPSGTVTADHVAHALRHQAAVNGWDVSEEQLLADALMIADWLHTQREVSRS